LIYKEEVAIQQRIAKDIWQDLFEFPLIETAKAVTKEKLLKSAPLKKWMGDAVILKSSAPVTGRQLLSHQLIHGQFIRISLPKKPELPGLLWLSEKEIKQYAFPRLFREYLEAL